MKKIAIRIISLTIIFSLFNISHLYLLLCHSQALKDSEIKWYSTIMQILYDFTHTKNIFPSPRLFFLGISDPIWISWGQNSDYVFQNHFQLSFLGVTKKYANWKYIALVFYSGLLKRMGYLEKIKTLNEALFKTSNDKKIKAFASREIADINHLYFIWHKQISPVSEKNLFTVIGQEFKTNSKNYEAWFYPIDCDTILEHYTTALKLCPEIKWLYIDIARLYKNSGEFEKSLETYKTAKNHETKLIATQYVAQINLLLNNKPRNYKNHIKEGIRPNVKQTLNVSIDKIKDIKTTHGTTTKVFDEKNININFTYFYQQTYKTISNKIHFPTQYYGTFKNLRRLNIPISIVDDNCLIENSSHFSPPFLKMFSPNLLETSKKNAALYYNEASQNQDEILLKKSPSLFLGGATSHNYYHFIFESLASLSLIEKDNFHPERQIIFYKEILPFQKELLEILGVTNECFVISEDMNLSSYKFTNALQLPCMANDDIPHPESIKFLRRRMAAPNRRTKPGKRVHLTRQKTRGIHRGKTEKFYNILKENGFHLINPGTMTVKEQVEFFKDVEILSAEAGAACSNLLFCPEDTKVILFVPSTHIFRIWETVTTCLNQKLWMCLTDTKTDYPNPYFIWNNLIQDIDIPNFKLCLKEVLSS